MILKNYEIEFLLLLCWLKQIGFFGTFDELEKHQLCKLISIRKSKHMPSISCKASPKVPQYLLLSSEKKDSSRV